MATLVDDLAKTEMTPWLDSVIPPNSYLSRYMAYTEPLSDAPRVFNFACGLATLAAAVGRNITYRFGDLIVPPNLWLLLIAPTGTCRKSTAMSMAKGILRKAVPDRIYPNEMTPEAMLQNLAEHPQGLMAHSEFGGFLAQLNRSYMAGMKETLTDLYDAPPVYTRKLKGSDPIEIHNPALSMLGGSTISWLVAQIREGDLRGGWLVRFLLIPVWHRERFIGIPPAADPDRKQSLIQELADISQLQGEVDLSCVEGQFTEWLRNLTRHAENSNDPEIVAGFAARLSQAALKIAVLLYAAEGCIGISEESLARAITFVEHVLADTKRLLQDELRTRWIEKESRRIEQRLEREPGMVMDHSPLLRFSGHSKIRFADVVAWMEETGQLEVLKDRKPWQYRLKVREVRKEVPNG